jgi:hypothetical protein
MNRKAITHIPSEGHPCRHRVLAVLCRWLPLQPLRALFPGLVRKCRSLAARQRLRCRYAALQQLPAPDGRHGGLP